MAIAEIIRQAAARHGVNPETLLRIGYLESRLNPLAANPRSSAKGLFQFTDPTRAGYGGFDPFDPAASADAAARLARYNIGVLRRGLGRDPTPAEVYLAHQQGAAGALKLLNNPEADAGSLVGDAAIRLNAGRGGMSARDFVSHWAAKYAGDQPQRSSAPAPVAAQAGDAAARHAEGSLAPPVDIPPGVAPQPAPSGSPAPIVADAFLPLDGFAPASLLAMPLLPQQPQREKERRPNTLGRSLNVGALFRDLAPV